MKGKKAKSDTDSTTIPLKRSTKAVLANYKICPEEPFDSVIKRILKENEDLKAGKTPIPVSKLKDFVRTSQLIAEMGTELKEYVLNPNIPNTPHNHREVWKESHPNETITSEEPIHHINGLHFDNRPENLEKNTAQEHRQTHADEYKERLQTTKAIIEDVIKNGHI
jgi:hypothetical protein